MNPMVSIRKMGGLPEGEAAWAPFAPAADLGAFAFAAALLSTSTVAGALRAGLTNLGYRKAARLISKGAHRFLFTEETIDVDGRTGAVI
jgi:hypothetical protein